VARAYVGLGSNLGDREQMIGRAVALLGQTPRVELVAVSTLRETAPVGLLDQPWFVNAAASLDTEVGPRALLERLLEIERLLGRTREGRRFGPREIDLDLLLYGDESVGQPGLTVPHPRLHERLFALEPLAELEPDLVVPGRGAVRALIAALD
jgi:2-amino-4-hydroxy-6-hydroxymethyldihydropteridine diphosphokinase